MAEIDHCFGYRMTWFAVKNMDIELIVSNFFVTNQREMTWKNGVKEIEESCDKILVSGPYKGWSFVIGKSLADPSQEEDIRAALLKLGKFADEVCYFSSHRTVGLYGFAQLIQRKIIRMYCYSGEEGHVYKNIGEKTEAEKKLLLNFAKDDEEIFEEGFDEIDEEDILRLAEQLSLTPESLIGMEEEKTIVADFVF